MPETKEKANKTNLALSLLDIFEVIVFAVAIVILVFSFAVRHCEVSGDSMNQTLKDKETLLISDLFYEPKRGDIIVFHQTGPNYNEPIIKRVIAVGGETIDIDLDTWTVSVTDKNGVTEVLDEPYAYIDNRKPYSQQVFPLYVPEGYLFVMGDNRNGSADSRVLEIGLVDERRVLGKVILRPTPFDKFGAVE